MEWKDSTEKLQRTYTFQSFTHALCWMNLCAFEIEKMDHHPEWKNVYNKVDVTLSTHSAGNKVTEKDRSLAKKMDELYQPFGSY